MHLLTASIVVPIAASGMHLLTAVIVELIANFIEYSISM